MELLYIWIKDYKNIKHQGFNISSKFNFEYDEKKNEILITKNVNYIKNFFGENILNVTALIGENGSGKSTLCQFILNNDSGFKVYGNEEEKKLILSFEDAPGNIPSVNTKIDYKIENRNYAYELLTNDEDNPHTRNIFYSPMFYPSEKDQSGSEYTDISTNRMYAVAKNRASRFINDETARQIQFLAHLFDEGGVANEEIVRRPKTIKFRAWSEYFDKDYDEDEPGVESFAEFDSIDKDGMPYKLMMSSARDEDLLGVLESFYSEDLPSDIKLQYYFFLYFINALGDNRIILPFAKIDTPSKKFTKKQFESLKKESSIERFIFGFFDVYGRHLEDKEDLNRLKEYLNNLKKLFKYITSQYEKSKLNNPEYYKSGIPGQYIEVSVDENENFEKFLNNFYYKYKKTYLDFVYFYWTGLSSGELANLNMQSRFYSVMNKVPKTFLLIIDEGELYLHPQWQKEFITNLLTGLNVIFKNKKVQVILTSHSPCIISDLPKDNIIFLRRGRKNDPPITKDIPAFGNCIVVKEGELEKMNKTFGANIHTLFSDAFFMDELIGKFAKGKIDEILDFCKRVENKKKNKNSSYTKLKKEYKEKGYRKVQILIGEEYLRNIIGNHLSEAETILKIKKTELELEIKKLSEKFGKDEMNKIIRKL